MKRFLLCALLTVMALITVFPFCGCVKQDDPREAVLSFHSFDGGGPAYSVEIENPEILTYRSENRYAKANHKELNGAGYDVIITFTGIKPGKTTVTVTEDMRAAETKTLYTATVSDDMAVTLEETK